MKHTDLISPYLQFLNGFSSFEPAQFDLNKKEISEAIFRHIFKLKNALWRHGVEFQRRKRIAISEMFQDIIAYYLKLTLDGRFEVILEEKKGRYQPDILIKRNGQNFFILEIKTTIGWDRNAIKGGIQKRIKTLSKAFDVNEDNIVYIFQSPWNVNKSFANKYWNEDDLAPRPLPKDFPFNKIRPLMTGDDPFYARENKNLDRTKYFKEYSDDEIQERASKFIVVPLELTIKEILNTE